MKHLLQLCLLPLGLMSAQAADVYDLDSGATRVRFDIERFGLHWVSAHFRQFDGDFVFDREGSASRVDVIVHTASIDCGDSRWNPRLRSEEWLNVQQFPLMSFHSQHIEFDGADHAIANGDLTLHGVTHPVVLSVNQLDCEVQSEEGRACKFTAQARVKRSDFGLPHGFWTGGDEVEISIDGVGMRAAKHSAPMPPYTRR